VVLEKGSQFPLSITTVRLMSTGLLNGIRYVVNVCMEDGSTEVRQYVMGPPPKIYIFQKKKRGQLNPRS
jgi:hypothetical protein